MKLYGFVVKYAKYIIRLLYRVKIYGAENEPNEPYIACINHSSFSDPIVTAICLKNQLHFIARNTLSRFWILRKIMNCAGVVFIHRERIDTDAIKKIVKLGKSGESIGIFPQGTRIRYKEPLPEQAEGGLGLIASLTHMPILPVSIVTKKRKLMMFHKTKFIIGKPIASDEYMNYGGIKRKDISEYLFSKVCEPFLWENNI